MWVSELPRSSHRVAYAPARRGIPMVRTRVPSSQLGALGATDTRAGLINTAQYTATGAKVGSVAGPIGAGIGAAVGAVAGILSSVLGSKKAPEDANFQQAQQLADAQGPTAVLSIGNKYLALAGLFDLQPGQIKGNIPIYKKYGHMGEQRFVTDMINLVYQAAQSGRITATDTPESIFTRIVQPWIDSWGYGPMQDHNAAMITMLLMGMIAEYVAGLQTRWLARGGQSPFGSLPAFRLASPVAPPVPMARAQPVQSVSAPAAAIQQVATTPLVTPAPAAGVLVAPANMSGSTGAAVNPQTGPVTTTGSTPATVVPVPVSSQGQIDLSTLAQQLLAQGQSQQQAYASALASLQAAGVQPTPQVQQATSQAVQTAGVGGGLFSGNSGLALTLAALTLGALALARPVKSPRSH